MTSAGAALSRSSAFAFRIASTVGSSSRFAFIPILPDASTTAWVPATAVAFCELKTTVTARAVGKGLLEDIESLQVQLDGDQRETRHIAAGSAEAGNKAERNGVAGRGDNDRCCLRRCHRGPDGASTVHHNDIDRQIDEFRREPWEDTIVARRETELQDDVAAVCVAELREAAQESREGSGALLGSCRGQNADPRNSGGSRLSARAADKKARTRSAHELPPPCMSGKEHSEG